ncbi:MAG: T9SS type A sorting domain-containing protein, partial [Ignavibacteriaceae bacterium]|nr:T9SS type A sorting domain-containing protein [Ignavibacteriaceae bacterium]
KNGSGCTCHSSINTAVTVTITGPSSLSVNTAGTYTLTITGGPLAAGGCDIAASSGTLATVNSDLQLLSGELTQVSPKSASSGSVTFQFSYTAPATTGNQTLYATGISVNSNNSSSGDAWNNAPNFTVSVTAVTPVELKSFTASISGSDVQLNWSTATEINNSGYRIDRMNLNNTSWETIAFIKGSGNSTINHEYTYTDRNLNAGRYTYRLVQVDFNGSAAIHNLQGEVNIPAPLNYELSQNYPNPFNPSTLIKYQLPENSDVNIKIYNASGEEVAQPVNGNMPAGAHEVVFNASHLSSGVYYYVIRAGNQFVQTKKMILLK